MSETTQEEQAAADDLTRRRKRAQDMVRGIRRCISQMQRPKCKKHIKVRRLQQIATALDSLSVLGFDDLGDGALITAIANAMKLERRVDCTEAFHDIYETVDLFQRVVMGEVIELDEEVPDAAG